MHRILFIEKNKDHKDFEDFKTHNILIEKIYYKNLNSKINDFDLCIVELDLEDKKYHEKIRKIISENQTVEFWAANSKCSRDDIVKAYESGCKNFVKYPLEKDILINNIRSYEKNISPEYSPIKINFSDFQNTQLLIVDDIEVNIELLKEVLKPFGMTPTCYTDPSKALEIINSQKFDLIILDIMMPYITGFEFAEKLKESEYNPNTPIIFISALDGKENKLKGYNLGTYAYIEKPFDIQTTRVQIYNILKIKKLQDSLFNEKEKLDNIFKFSDNEIILADRNFNIMSNSNRYTTPLSDRNRNFIDLINKINPEKIVNYILDFQSMPQENLSVKIQFKNILLNKDIPTDINISKIFTENNTLNGYLIMVRDVSQEISIQNQKETFIATLTHDLKTPIRAQIRALELILDNKFGVIDNNLTEILKEVLNSCKFMQYMTDNLLTKYKTENGQLNIVKEKNSMYELIKNNSENLKYLIEQKNQKIKIFYNTNIKELDFDSYEIERVLNNLIINASEYTQENGEIIIKVEEKDQFLQVSVSDNGWGIPKEDLEKIFDEYISSAKKFRKVGSGLGLYICKRIIEEHNGEIFVNSEEGKGSEFIFTLPLVKSIVKVK